MKGIEYKNNNLYIDFKYFQKWNEEELEEAIKGFSKLYITDLHFENISAFSRGHGNNTVQMHNICIKILRKIDKRRLEFIEYHDFDITLLGYSNFGRNLPSFVRIDFIVLKNHFIEGLIDFSYKYRHLTNDKIVSFNNCFERNVIIYMNIDIPIYNNKIKFNYVKDEFWESKMPYFGFYQEKTQKYLE